MFRHSNHGNGLFILVTNVTKIELWYLSLNDRHKKKDYDKIATFLKILTCKDAIWCILIKSGIRISKKKKTHTGHVSMGHISDNNPSPTNRYNAICCPGHRRGESCCIERPRVLQQRLARCRVHMCPKHTAAWGKIRTVQLTPEYIRDNTVKGFEFSFIDSDTWIWQFLSPLCWIIPSNIPYQTLIIS